MSEEAPRLISEIQKNCESWRAAHTDLPLTLLVLSRVIRVTSDLQKNSHAKGIWDALTMTGDTLATRRDLFIVAEAIGHIAPDKREAEEKRVRNELAVVISEGEDLHKVRALRALSFIASEECVPLLEKGLEDADPWVQSTALRTLLRLDLRSRTPRTVLNAFLFKKFRESVAWASWNSEASLLPEASRYFQFNRGLLAALIKERGGKRAIPLALLFWFLSSLVSALAGIIYMTVPLVLFAVGAPIVLAVVGVFIGAMAIVLAALIAAAFVTLPVWARGIVGQSEHVDEIRKSRVSLIVFAVLDYVLAVLLFLKGWPHGILRPGIFLGVFVLLLGVSWLVNLQNPKIAERLRSGFSCLVAAMFGWLGNLSSQLDLVTVAIFGLAIVHGIRVLWWIGAPLVASPRRIIEIASLTAGFFRWLFQLLFKTARQTPPAIRASFESVRQASRVRSPGAQPSAASGAVDVSVTIPKRRNVRLHPKHVIIALMILAVFASLPFLGSYLVPKLASLKPQFLAILPWLRSVPVMHKYYLYGIAGFIVLITYCCLAVLCIWFAWDEIKIVERIRFHALSKGDVQEEKTKDFVARMFQIIRDKNTDIKFRVQAVSALRREYPRSDKEFLQELRTLAREGLPVRVVAAIHQAIEARLKDREQSRSHIVEVDPAELNKAVEAYWNMQRGSVLRPAIYKTLYAVLVCSLVAAILNLLLYLNNNRLIDGIALLESISGGVLVYRFISTAGVQSSVRKGLFMIGLILITVGLTHPLQSFLIDTSWPNIAFNAGLERIDSSTLRALVVPTIFACLIAQLGHTIYLLESSADFEVKAEEQGNFITRRGKRLKAKSSVLPSALLLAMMATSIQSEPMQELLDLRNESMPFFVMNENEIELKNLVTDGRVIRVALVNVQPDAEPPEKEDPDLPIVYDIMISGFVNAQESHNYTPSLERTFPLTVESARPIYENAEDPRDRTYGGEVWLASRNGQIESWQPFRQSCLGPPRVTENSVIFNFRLKCTYQKRNRVVAIVYNKRRSEYVRSRAETMNVLREFELDPPLNRRVLADTLSPFVRTTWTSIF